MQIPSKAGRGPYEETGNPWGPGLAEALNEGTGAAFPWCRAESGCVVRRSWGLKHFPKALPGPKKYVKECPFWAFCVGFVHSMNYGKLSVTLVYSPKVHVNV